MRINFNGFVFGIKHPMVKLYAVICVWVSLPLAAPSTHPAPQAPMRSAPGDKTPTPTTRTTTK
jgi:hypothetical protein